ncbi:CARDB domain-containing protein [Cystobacter ferrugineus]|uniref:CARDB domain-containing protein n=1 Tax=Cystobacter ferrugineus TaxID=83449 RepID=A0A1L9B8V8_9BACT|nr:CARDB domain-containing protein [Cystobacter ferrugineus]OJH38689.1 hypothetical protein BON30_20875 [Cystobacter ferrugineus]
METGNHPDFVITSVTGPTIVEPGQPITAQVTVCNQGNESDYAHVLVLLSEDQQFDIPSRYGPPEDAVVGSPAGTWVSQGTCSTLSISGHVPPTIPLDTGTLYLGAALDPSNTSEIITDNNTHPGYELRVAAGADFVITSVTGPASVAPWQPFTAQVNVCNQGTRTTSTQVMLLLSEDEHLSVPYSGPIEDSLAGRAPVAPLAPGQCTTVSVYCVAARPPASPPDTNAFLLGAVVDPEGSTPELLEDNNTLLGGWISFTP